MRVSFPQDGIAPVIFFLVLTVGIGAFVAGTSYPARLWQSTELGRTRVPAMLQARAIRTEKFQPGGRGEVLARVQAIAVYELQGASRTVTRVGAHDDAIPNVLWQKWDAQQAAGDLKVEVSISRDNPAEAYIAPPGLERGQMPAMIALLIITGISVAVVAGLVSSVVHLVRGR
jgi:hypothetical protein